MSGGKIIAALLIGLCIGRTVHAQDTVKKPVIEDIEFEDEEEVEEVEDTTVKVMDFMGKTRQDRWQESIRDSQPLGEWSEKANSRLVLRHVPKETIDELRNMKALQYDKTSEKKTAPWVKDLGMWVIQHAYLIRYFYYIILGAIFVLVVLMFLQKSDLQLFRRRSKSIQEEEAETVAEGPQNYEALAQAAIANGDYREAIRARYLQALHILTVKELVAPGKDKTNMDYLRELSTTAFHKPFSALTRHYEYIWYGKVPVSNGQFTQLDEQFAEFKKSLR